MSSLRQRRDVLALWVPFVWYAIATSRAVSLWLTLFGYEPGALNYLEGSPIDRAVYSVLMLLGILILLRRRIEWPRLLMDNKWVIVLFVYMLVSISWSQFPQVGFKRWTRATGDLIMVLVVLSESEPVEAISKVLRRCFYINLSLSLIFVKYFRTIGTGWDQNGAEMWIGVTTHKNVLGEVCMISGIFFVWSILRDSGMRRGVDIAFLLVSLWLLGGSESYTSITAILTFCVGVGLVCFLQTAKSRVEFLKQYLVVASIVVVVGLLVAGFTAQTFSSRSIFSAGLRASGRDSTLTGRTELWQDMLDIGSKRPIGGVGYGNFWIGNLSDDLWDRHIWRPTQGHNGYLDVYLELGIAGVCILFLVVISSFRQIIRTFEYDFEYGRFRFVFLVVLLLHNMTESSFLRGANNLWFIFLLVAIMAPGIWEAPVELTTQRMITD